MNVRNERLRTMISLLLGADLNVYFDALRVWAEDPERFQREGYDERFHIEEPESISENPEEAELSLFLGVAQDLGYTHFLDWSGEDSDGDFETWTEGRMEALNRTYDTLFIEDWKDELDLNKLDRGDYILHKFRLIGDSLAKIGYSLIFLNEGGDSYYPFIIRQEA